MNINAMTEQARLDEARALAVTLDRLVRHPKRINPTAPWIIPATMIVVAAFALICIVIKLIMNYLQSKSIKSKSLDRPHSSSPDLPTTPEDQASMATTASMKTRGSIKMTTNRTLTKGRPPPVSLYQMKQKHSPSATKSKTHRAAMKAISRAARAEANRSISRDGSRQQDDGTDNEISNRGDDSPNLSQRSIDSDDAQVINQSSLAYGVSTSRGGYDDTDRPGYSGNQDEPPIRDIDDDGQQPNWPQMESDI